MTTQPRGKGWEASENVEVMKLLVKHRMSDETSETDDRWKDLAKEVVKIGDEMNPKKGWTERRPHLIREHVKEMVAIVRSISHTYSSTEAAELPPSSTAEDGEPVDTESQEFLEAFRRYTDKLFQHLLNLESAKGDGDGSKKRKSDFGGSKWWSSELIFRVRLFCFTFDNKKTLEKTLTTRSKFAQEADARKEEAEERKRKITENEKEEREQKKQLVQHLASSSDAIKDIKASFVDFVEAYRSPLRGHGPPPLPHQNRLDEVENKIVNIEAALKDVQNTQTQGFAQIMHLLQQQRNA